MMGGSCMGICNSWQGIRWGRTAWKKQLGPNQGACFVCGKIVDTILIGGRKSCPCCKYITRSSYKKKSRNRHGITRID